MESSCESESIGIEKRITESKQPDKALSPQQSIARPRQHSSILCTRGEHSRRSQKTMVYIPQSSQGKVPNNRESPTISPLQSLHQIQK